MTEKLYYADAYLHEFTARVTACEPGKTGFFIELDRTAFFPEGGGQPADTGTIGPARVCDVQEKGGRILHSTDMALPVGESFACALDWEQRRRRMQNHSGEHVFSGTVHRLFGLNNVGFHMGEACMTIDFDGELDEKELRRAEDEANGAVRDNLPIRCFFPFFSFSRPFFITSFSFFSFCRFSVFIFFIMFLSSFCIFFSVFFIDVLIILHFFHIF